jgi:hypothetical protein
MGHDSVNQQAAARGKPIAVLCLAQVDVCACIDMGTLYPQITRISQIESKVNLTCLRFFICVIRVICG